MRSWSSIQPSVRSSQRLPLGDSPEAIYLSPDGKWIAAAIEENDQVMLVDTATNKVVPQHQDARQESGARGVES